MSPRPILLTVRSVYGRTETTKDHVCIRKGAFVARIIRACAASEGRSRGRRRNGIPGGRYALPCRTSHVYVDDNPIEDLTSKKRYAEAGHVLVDYAEDVREAVIALVQGNQFSEARRIVS